MLQSIRDHTQGWIAGVIISVLILSFALWGIHSYLMSGEGSSAVATVNGKDISRIQFLANYERLQRQNQIANLQMGKPVQVNESDLRKQTLDNLIKIQVLQQNAVNYNFKISFAEVEAYLEAMPEFQDKGKFSAARFNQLISNAGFSAGEFLNNIQTSLLIDQPRLGMLFSSFVLPYEVDTNVQLINQERNISYVMLTSAALKNKPITITDAEIKSYYDNHKADYKIPEQAVVQYVELTVKDLQDKIVVTDDQLRKFYNDNSNIYVTKETDKDKKTVTKVLPYETVKNKVKQDLTLQMAEERFADLRDKLADISYQDSSSLEPAAKALNLTIQTSKPFNKSSGEGVFADNKICAAAFSDDVLAGQNNSDLLQVGPDNVIVLRIKSFVPANNAPLDSVKAKIEETLRQEKISNELKTLAADIIKEQNSGHDLPALSAKYDLHWNDLGFQGRYSDKVDSAILQSAFNLPEVTSVQYTTAKAKDGLALIIVKGIKYGLINDSKPKYDLFSKQAEHNLADLEYNLYESSLLQQAKIKINLGNTES